MRWSFHGVGGWLPQRIARPLRPEGVSVEAEPAEIAVIKTTSRENNGPETRTVQLGFNALRGGLCVQFTVPNPALLIEELCRASSWAQEGGQR